jgi:oligopeptide transport system ATP-binding protein
MKRLLQVKNLKVTFRSQEQDCFAVRGIDFFLDEGETIGIVGESGCGKSTLAKALLKLLPPQTSSISGELIFNQHNLVTFSETQMQKIRGKEIAMIFQDPLSFLNPTRKIGFQILEGFYRHFKDISRKEGEQTAFQILMELGFSCPKEVMEAYPHTLSGGMCQRVIIALALICEPKILLADEPTSSIDAAKQGQILSFLKQIQRQKKMSIILITHDINIVSQFCDRILVMYAGKIVESGSVNAVLCNPQHPYTEKLIQSIHRLDHPKQHPLVTIEGVPPSLNLPFNRCGFCNRCAHAMNICADLSPPLYQISDLHWSACFRHDKRFK